MMGTEDNSLRARMPALLGGAAQLVLRTLFPPRCISCGGAVSTDFGLCGECWRETEFIGGLTCDCCGAPLPGEEEDAVHCDDCRRQPRPWHSGRAAIRYAGTGRKLVLAFKHGDRLDLARPLGGWIARAAMPLIEEDTIVAPIPLHPLRMLKRRYNQSALLSQQIARAAGIRNMPDLFVRIRATASQQGKGYEDRFENLENAFRVPRRRAEMIAGRPVLVVDDVMTSGATFAAAAKAAYAAGAARVDVVSLARAGRDS